MVQVTGGTSDVDGNLTQSALYLSGTNARTTIFGYDWRDRRISTTTNAGLNNSGNSYRWSAFVAAVPRLTFML